MPAPATGRTVLEPPPLAAAPEVADLLAELGLGALLAEQAGAYQGRNDNWFGPTTGGSRVFVKRLGGRDVPQRLARMARFERVLARARQDGAPLGWDTPELLGVRADPALVVFAHLDGAEPLCDLAPDGELPADLARALGRTLAEVHALPRPDDDADPDASYADASDAGPPAGPSRPGFLDFLDFLTEKTWQAASAAELELWALLQHDAELAAALRTLLHGDAGTPVRVPSHGDLRLDQFLRHDGRLHLTDWEEFRLAPPERDLGSLTGEFVHRAVRRLATGLDEDPALDDPRAAHAAIMRQGRLALEGIRPTVRAVLAGYREHAPAPVDLHRVAALAGWHLFDRILAGARHANRLHPLDRAQAGIGRTLILAPQRSAAAIGLTEAP
ncbi:class V lanthionine synthetase subunit LxmK [Kitasatospora cineracea]|uniref:class V lanthionine synthetase subunit LxmK n=1 Tax=Kitasatospora cineracea TaxID=88074 RepID=UPI00381A64F0